MSDSGHRIYASTPFKFIVGGNPYYIHADLVSQHSRPLDRMINGQMAEAQKGFAILEDVDEDTFERYLEWSYKGYYKAADFEVEAKTAQNEAVISVEHAPFEEEFPVTEAEQVSAPAEEAPAEEAPIADDFLVAEDTAPAEEALPAEDTAPAEEDPAAVEIEWGIWGMSRPDSKKKKKKKGALVQGQTITRQNLKESFLQRPYTTRQVMNAIPPARANREPQENYSKVFLSHARLYVFAEKYDIQVLKTLALEELHHTLAIYTLYPQRTGDIIALLHYVYAEVDVTAKSNGDLRSVLRDYIGFEMKVLLGDKDLKGLLIKNGGLLLGDVLEMAARLID